MGDEKPENCLMCGLVSPISHVMVRDERGHLLGRVCGTHTLYEVIFSGFSLTIEETDETEPERLGRCTVCGQLFPAHLLSQREVNGIDHDFCHPRENPPPVHEEPIPGSTHTRLVVDAPGLTEKLDALAASVPKPRNLD